MNDRIPNTEKTPKSKRAFQPLVYAVLIVVGVYIGSNFGGETILVHNRSAEENPNKLVNIINKIDEMYVDSVQKRTLIDKAIEAILEDLDPHSYYITPEELSGFQEPLEGNFEGIGVEFLIQRDTLMVVSPIEGGPSEQAGIRAGDRIVEVDGENIAGVGLTNEKVMKMLKGEKGTTVNLGITRRGEDELRSFAIVRDRIPIHSVVAALNVEDEIGYIRLTRFAKTSYEEFMQGMEKIVSEGAERIIIDLRGNGGGYLNVAIPMVEEFLEPNQLIVYTEGKASPRYDYKSRRKGRYSDMDVVVLIDHGSASASEILAGALQDHDRSITVGRRSFGKGLVQDEIGLPDKSALRLTVARYYTPTGRSIQRPYGKGVNYRDDYDERYGNGEFYERDSIPRVDSLRYVTPGGRVVYGGGGISPDVFVPFDTTGASYYLSELSYGGIIRSFSIRYAEEHKSTFEAFDDVEQFVRDFKMTDAMLEALADFADNEGVSKDRRGMADSRKPIEVRFMAHLARNMFGEAAYYRVLLEDDSVFKEALKVARSFQEYEVIEGALGRLNSNSESEPLRN